VTEQRPLAVVTGAGSGIGAALTGRLAGAGFDVAAVDVEFGADFTELPEHHNIRPVDLDITDEAALTRFVGELGPTSVHVLLNVAAIRPTGTVPGTDSRTWRRCLEVNVTGPFLVSRALLPRIPRGGRILNVCSAAGYGRRDLAAYATSKAALITLTKCLALDHAVDGIRVNAVLPGTVATPMLEAITGLPTEQNLARTTDRTVTGSVLSAEDVAAGVLQFVTAHELISGAVLPIGILPYQW
jgi:3-oxoacyl-[acyl-carrier protein] reductase